MKNQKNKIKHNFNYNKKINYYLGLYLKLTKLNIKVFKNLIVNNYKMFCNNTIKVFKMLIMHKYFLIYNKNLLKTIKRLMKILIK